MAYIAYHLLDVREEYVIHFHVSSFPKDNYSANVCLHVIVFVAQEVLMFCAEITQRLFVR